jgi:uncharacterized membrane protein
MKWIRQSFALFKTNPRQGLYVAVASLGFLVVSSFLVFGGVWLASLGMVYLQAFLYLKLSQPELNLRFFELKKFPGHRSLIVLSVLMAPTNMMMGTLIALIEGDQSWIATLILSVVFSMVCSCVYILIFHAVGFVVIKKQSLVVAADSSLRGFHKNSRALIVLGFLLMLVLALGALPLGVGLFLALPLIFYSYYFSFRELYA